MTFPTSVVISTDNLDSSSDDPSLARADLLTTVQAVNAIIASADTMLGVPTLDGNAQIKPEQMPNSIEPDTLTLAPGDGIVKIEDRARLQIKTAAQVLAWTDPAVGDMCLIADDLTGANPKLAMYDGSDWRYVALSTWTVVS